MTRITKDMADWIARNASNTQFKERFDALTQSEHDVAMEIYNSLYDEKLLKQLSKIPEAWLRQDECLRFNCGGYTLRLTVKKAVCVPYSSHCANLGNITGDLADKAKQFAMDKDKAVNERNSAYSLTKKMVESCGTIAKLHKAWPEGKQFYSRYLDITKGSSVPMVQVSEINKALGLE